MAVAEPLIFELHNLPITEGCITIRPRGGGKVLTSIEFLSLANKGSGTGQEKYLEKQEEVLQSDASLVEIDVVRPGHRVLALPPHEIPDMIGLEPPLSPEDAGWAETLLKAAGRR